MLPRNKVEATAYLAMALMAVGLWMLGSHLAAQIPDGVSRVFEAIEGAAETSVPGTTTDPLATD